MIFTLPVPSLIYTLYFLSLNQIFIYNLFNKKQERECENKKWKCENYFKKRKLIQTHPKKFNPFSFFFVKKKRVQSLTSHQTGTGDAAEELAGAKQSIRPSTSARTVSIESEHIKSESSITRLRSEPSIVEHPAAWHNLTGGCLSHQT